MPSLDENKLKSLCFAIDAVTNLDVYGKDVITKLYRAAVARHGGDPLSLLVARALAKTVKPRDAVIIGTGFPERAWIARPIVETDGPPGAATFRSLFLGLGALPVILIDEPFVPVMEATCRGAGMVTIDIEYFENVKREGGFQAVFVVGVPLDRTQAHRKLDALLAQLQPPALVAIERPAQNALGVYHQVGGQRIPDDAVADIDYIFNRAHESGKLTIGIGDGGNEIGMGNIGNDLESILPVTRKCQCPCGGGSAAATTTDLLLTATCSNWGATAISAALALITGNRHALQSTEMDKRTLEACSNAGGIDGGINYNTDLAVDDIPWSGYRIAVDACRDIVDRALGRP